MRQFLAMDKEALQRFSRNARDFALDRFGIARQLAAHALLNERMPRLDRAGIHPACCARSERRARLPRCRCRRRRRRRQSRGARRSAARPRCARRCTAQHRRRERGFGERFPQQIRADAAAGPARLDVQMHEPRAVARGEADDLAVDFGEPHRVSREDDVAHPGARLAPRYAARAGRAASRGATRCTSSPSRRRRPRTRRRAAGGSAPRSVDSSQQVARRLAAAPGARAAGGSGVAPAPARVLRPACASSTGFR